MKKRNKKKKQEYFIKKKNISSNCRLSDSQIKFIEDETALFEEPFPGDIFIH